MMPDDQEKQNNEKHVADAELQAQEKMREPAEEPPKETYDEVNFDFGGLPRRDLKKNLGCG